MPHYKSVLKKILKQFNSKEYKLNYKNTEQEKVDKKHFLEVVEITKKLWKKPPVALQIAELCHDLDRIYPKREINTKNVAKKDYDKIKKKHSITSALIFSEVNHDLPKELLIDVNYLIIRHEVGGDKTKKLDSYTKSYDINKAANPLYYADKLSFFYSNIYEYSKRGKEKLKNKIVGMMSITKVNRFGNKNAEVGYWIGKDHRGKGLTKE